MSNKKSSTIKNAAAGLAIASLGIGSIAGLAYLRTRSIDKAPKAQRQPIQPPIIRSQKEQEQAVHDYINKGSAELNTALRQGQVLNESNRQMRDGVDQWVKSQPSVQGTYVRGIPNLSNNPFTNSKVGDIIDDNGFMSVSTKLDTAITFATSGFAAGYDREPATLIFVRGKAVRLPNEAQGEHLFPRGSSYKVTKTRMVKASFSYDRATAKYTRDRKGPIKAHYKAIYVDIVEPERQDTEGLQQLNPLYQLLQRFLIKLPQRY